MVNNYLPKGKTWRVVEQSMSWPPTPDTIFVVLANVKPPCNPDEDCAREAAAGNPDALAAVLMCTDDTTLQWYVRGGVNE